MSPRPKTFSLSEMEIRALLKALEDGGITDADVELRPALVRAKRTLRVALLPRETAATRRSIR